MPAFGYGSTTNPSWRTQEQAPMSPLNPNSAFSIAPAMSQPNWTLQASNPWSDPMKRDSGIRAAGGSAGVRYTSLDPWANPLDQLFNSIQGQPYIDQMNANAPMVDQYAFSEAAGNGTGRASPLVRTGQARASITPGNAQEFYNSIDKLNSDQLMRLTGNQGVWNQFSSAAQMYKNAYANPNYGKQLPGQQGGWSGTPGSYGANPLSEAQTMDYLQQSYDKLVGKMNSNYLL